MRLSPAFFLLIASTFVAARAQAPAYASNPKYIAAMDDAAKLKKSHKYGFAEDALKKANKLAEGKSRMCLEQLYEVQFGLHEYKDSVATASQLAAIAETPEQKSMAEMRGGQALLSQAGDKAKPAQLEAAHTALQAALSDYPRNISARYSNACLLARMGKMDEAGKEFAECSTSASPRDPMKLRAKHFAEDPSLSLHKMAPAFEVTALDGAKFNLDNMGGRVVLVDFWATWCGPCNEELPNVKRMARDFKDEPFTIISISWDSDEGKWKDFIKKNEMTWLQYRDADHSLSNRFAVEAIPHYFTIDSDGVLTAEILGSGTDVESKIRRLLKKAHEAHPTTVQASASTR